MLIPRFTLSQDSKSLTITLLARYCKLKDLDVEVDDNSFLFSCWPYYLRLRLPGNVVDNDNTKSSYDTDSGEFTFRYDKAIEDEIFEDLDFITKFLITKVDASYGFETDDQKITVLSGDKVDEKDVPSTNSSDLTYGFGFALQGSTHFKTLHALYFDVFEVDPFKINLEERHKLRIKNEELKFNLDHYLCDLLESEEIEDLMKQIAPWENLDMSNLTFTAIELDFLKELPNKVYNLSHVQVNLVHNTLIDILYAYCYNQRVNSYDENSESGWNIVTLCASFSWLDVFETPRETLIFAFRRSLIYPLYRHFDLSHKVFEDLKKLVGSGEKFIIKCLIEIYHIFLEGDCCRYILNNFFIKDYINYIMKWNKGKWQEYLQSLYKVDIKKSDLGLNLLEAEQQVLIKGMAELEVRGNDSDDALESDSSSEYESSSSDDSVHSDADIEAVPVVYADAGIRNIPDKFNELYTRIETGLRIT